MEKNVNSNNSSEESSKINKNKTFRPFINTDSYDEMKFIDDFVDYSKNNTEHTNDEIVTKIDSSRPFTEIHNISLLKNICLEDESSCSTVLDLYLNYDKTFNRSHEDDYSISQTSSKNTLDVVDLSDRPNLVRLDPNHLENSSRINQSRLSEESQVKDYPNVTDIESVSVEMVQKNVPPAKIHVILKSPAYKPIKKNIKYNIVLHPSIVILDHLKSNTSNKKHNLVDKNEINKTLNTLESREANTLCESESLEYIRTIDLLQEAEKRTVQQNIRTRNDVPLRRFVIEIEEKQSMMDHVFKLNDLKKNIILGKVSKRGNNGYYQKNWFHLKGNFFTCFNGKKERISPNRVPSERVGDLLHPEDPGSFLTKKYTLDLTTCRILLSKKRGKKDIFTCYSECIPAESDLVDITNVVLANIQECVTGYKVLLQKENQKAEVTLSCLNFCLKNNDGYRFYKPDTIDDLLKWIIAFKFRLGQIELNIGA